METQALTLKNSALPARPTGTPWGEVVAAYLASAIDSEHTRRAYRRHLEDALEALEADHLDQITGADLAAYRAELVADGRGAATHSQALAALRAFLRWAGTFGAHGITYEVVREALRTPRTHVERPYQVLSEPEVAAILEKADSSRDRALLAVLLGGGLRAAETVTLDVADILEDGDGATVLYVRCGKGRKDRTVPIGAEVAALLRAYLEATGSTLADDGPLFRAHDRAAGRRDRRRLSTRSVGYAVRKAASGAGVRAKTISPHSLRHTYALRALRAGGNLVAVSKLLGHASVTTTQRYLDHLALSELRETVPALPISEVA